MARKMVYLDDLDGTAIEEDKGGPVTLSIRGEYFEIDLTEKNQAKLDKALEPFISVATKVGPPTAMTGRSAKPTTRTKVPGQGKDYLDAVRRWARDNGKQVADRGRIAASIVEEYEASRS